MLRSVPPKLPELSAVIVISALSKMVAVAVSRRAGRSCDCRTLAQPRTDGCALAGEELANFAALLRRVPAEFGTTVIATASPAFAVEKEDRVLEFVRGVIVRDSALQPEPEA